MLINTVTPSELLHWNWDLSKATLYGNNSSLSWIILYWIAISDDWKNLYYWTYNWDGYAGSIRQRKLNTDFDITTLSSYDYSSFSIWGGYRYWVYPTNVFIKGNGNYLYVFYSDFQTTTASYLLNTYQLTTPYDISNKTLLSSVSVDYWYFYITDDWTKLRYTIQNDWTYYKELTTPYVIEYNWTKLNSTFYSWIYISNDGKYFYACNNNTMIQYSLATPFDISWMTQINTFSSNDMFCFDTYWDNLYVWYGARNNSYINQYKIS